MFKSETQNNILVYTAFCHLSNYFIFVIINSAILIHSHWNRFLIHQKIIVYDKRMNIFYNLFILETNSKKLRCFMNINLRWGVC